MNKLGALIKFKDGTTAEEAAAALEKIMGLLDIPTTGGDYVPDPSRGQRFVKWVPRPFLLVDLIQSYNPDHGEPVWYIP